MIEFKSVSKSFGELCILKDFDIALAEKKINVIIGANGSGKTTLLRLLAGLEKPDGGKITGVPEKISYIFQDERLLPFLTVRQNLDFVLTAPYPDKEERGAVIDKYLELADLKGFENYYPKKLSGGMRQRLSIARAFAYPSDLLLMDEPFKALDIKRMEELIHQITDLFAERPRTVVFVTHSINEAVMIGDEIFLMSSRPLRIKKSYCISADKNSRGLTDPEIIKMNNDIIENFEK